MHQPLTGGGLGAGTHAWLSPLESSLAAKGLVATAGSGPKSCSKNSLAAVEV